MSLTLTLSERRQEMRERLNITQSKRTNVQASADTRAQQKVLAVVAPLPLLFPDIEYHELSNPVTCRIVPTTELSPIQAQAWQRLWRMLLSGESD